MWPDEETLKKGLNPNDFRLKDFKFLYNSQYCQDRLSVGKNYTGAIISNNVAQSSILVPPHINEMQDIGE